MFVSMRKTDMNKRFAGKVPAYFTAEAAMVLSVTLGIILLLVYIIIFQYDRCLLEQDIGALALKGCSVQATNKNELLQELELYGNEIYMDKYVAWKSDEISIALSGNTVKVEQKGQLLFPFAEKSDFGEKEKWEVKAMYENKSISPVLFLRTYRRLIGGK